MQASDSASGPIVFQFSNDIKQLLALLKHSSADADMKMAVAARRFGLVETGSVRDENAFRPAEGFPDKAEAAAAVKLYLRALKNRTREDNRIPGMEPLKVHKEEIEKLLKDQCEALGIDLSERETGFSSRRAFIRYKGSSASSEGAQR